MAERRMFAKTIVTSDAFLDMPISARCLYFALGMEADDDGFVNKPHAIMRLCGATLDDLNVLISKKFIIAFEDGVIVIKHWRINNFVRKDTYNPTKYMEHKDCLTLDENNAYVIAIKSAEIADVNEPSTDRQRAVNEPYTQDRLGKDRLGNNIVPKGTLVQTDADLNAGDEFEVDEELDDLLKDVKKTKPSMPRQQMTRFEKFWEMYPKKQGRQNAERVWKRLNPSEEETNKILIGLANAKQHDSRFREQRFTPMPSTWLNAGSWEDEFVDDAPSKYGSGERSYDVDDFLDAAVRRTKK